jgi:hypothetical protein
MACPHVPRLLIGSQLGGVEVPGLRAKRAREERLVAVPG